MSRRRLVGVLMVAAVLSGACGDDGASTPSTTAPPTVPTTSEAPTTTEAPPTSVPAPTTTAAPTTAVPTTSAPGASTTLPGEPFDTYVPRAGELVAVVGVAHDDVLNVRAGPGAEYDVIASLGPLADDVVGTGEGRLLIDSIWWRVVAGGVEGWVNSRFIARLGGVEDLTALVVDRAGATPTGADMSELGLLVADQLASDDPPTTITLTVAPTVGDLGEVTYDLVGLGDDAQRGWRLHVFGQPLDGGGFSLKAVEATPLCDRGVTDEGFCV